MPHKDRAAKNEYSRNWKRENRHRLAPRQQAYDAARHANARAEHYSCEGTITTDEAAELLAAAVCHYCGYSDMLGLDHVRPLSDGGQNRPENIVAACHSCNSSKSRQDRPGRWAWQHDSCVECGKTDWPHICHGQCTRCYSRIRHRRERLKRGAAT